MEMYRLSDYEKASKNVLSPWSSNFYHGVSEEGQTYRENFEAIQRYLLRPRMLRDVSKVDTRTAILGHQISFPVCTSPTAHHKWAHASAERISANAVTSAGTVFTLSSFADTLLEDVASACSNNALLFFNLYIFSDRDLVLNLVRRAEDSGYKALVVTVDSPCPGPTVGNKRDSFYTQMKKAPFTSPNIVPKERQYSRDQPEFILSLFNPACTWSDITWLKSVTKLPIVVKGILTGEDAELAIDSGADAILVSNHGGRQLAGATGTIEVLREVVLAARGRVEVYIDGGFRTGSDVLKALALGARAVFIGRPVLYALAQAGDEGVTDMLNMLKAEFTAAMSMSGCSKISDITPALVKHRSEIPAKL